MKTIIVQVLRTQVKLSFPKEAVLTITDMGEVTKSIKGKIYEGAFLMHSGHTCTFKRQTSRKPIQMDLFNK